MIKSTVTIDSEMESTVMKVIIQGTIKEVQSSLDRSTKFGTFLCSPSSAFYMDIDIQVDKDICCENCREGLRGTSSGALEHG